MVSPELPNLSRLNTSLPHMILDRLNGHLLPVEDTGSQGRLHIGLFKDLTEMIHLSGTRKGYYLQEIIIAKR